MRSDCLDRLPLHSYEFVGGGIHLTHGPTWSDMHVDVQLVTLAADLAHLHGVAGPAECYEDDQLS